MSRFSSVTRDTQVPAAERPRAWSARARPSPTTRPPRCVADGQQKPGDEARTTQEDTAGRLGARPPEEDVAWRPLALTTGRQSRGPPQLSEETELSGRETASSRGRSRTPQRVTRSPTGCLDASAPSSMA